MELRLFVVDGAEPECCKARLSDRRICSLVATAAKGWYVQTAEACKPRVSHVHARDQSECFTQPAAVLHGMSRQNMAMVSTTVHYYLHALLI